MKRTDPLSLGAWQERLTLSSQARRLGYGSHQPEAANWGVRLRVRILWAITIASLALLSARILYLQIFESGQHSLLSEANHIELIAEPAPRGIIYDRSGTALVENIESGGSSGYLRAYPLGPKAAQITGYMGEVNEQELGCQQGICYTPGATVGRTGVEAVFERFLKGRDGGKLVEMDARGAVVRELGANAPEPGSDVTLTVDAKLQEAMYQALRAKRGSAVMLDLQGKVLGLVSSPSYDPNVFGIRRDAQQIATYLHDEADHPFLDRPLGAMYPPGSVFKLVTAYAGLMDQKITAESQILDTGELKVGSYRYGNWYFDQYGRTEGEIGLVRALARSNDIFFYKTGEMVGVDRLVYWARQFGYGAKTGIELPGEVEGIVPDRLWKERMTGESWFLGNTYHFAIGQGDLLVTPLQVARATVAAVSGRVCDVSLRKETTPSCRDLGLTTADIGLVTDGMKAACSSGGTAFPFFDFEPRVMCKTGTAQHAGQKTDEDKAHAWITVAYPAENPRVVLTVMLEAAGEGSAEAGPVAREILSAWRDLGN
jgi:penicillin-binding protein 2